jgi:hypothetical protein
MLLNYSDILVSKHRPDSHDRAPENQVPPMYDMYRYEIVPGDRAAEQLPSRLTVAELPRRRARKSHSVLPAVLTVASDHPARPSTSS